MGETHVVLMLERIRDLFIRRFHVLAVTALLRIITASERSSTFGRNLGSIFTQGAVNATKAFLPEFLTILSKLLAETSVAAGGAGGLMLDLTFELV